MKDPKDTDLSAQNDKLKGQIAELKKELEDKEWASKKTNEGIKILYRELEKTNEELKKLDQLKSDFISMVSHELRTPLTTIRESVSLILDEVLGGISKDQREILDICRDDIDRLKRIIDNLLDISKIEAGKLHVRRVLINVADVVAKVVSSFVPRAQSKGLDLKTVFSREKIEVYADKDKIVQVFSNLVGNAFKFTDKGYIEISVADKDDCIECYVRDTGGGIAQEDLSKVFSKFQQFGRKPGPGEKGTGLGLAICKGIIALHRGDIWVESQLSKGTKFIFTLPKYTARKLFEEHVADGLKEAAKEAGELSILKAGIEDFGVVQSKIGEKRLAQILQDLEELVENNLHHKTDFAVATGDSILILLLEAGKEYAAQIKTRLQEAFSGFLSGQGLSRDIKIIWKDASFPQDGADCEQLLIRLESTENMD